MFYRKARFPIFLAIVATAITLGALGWDGAQAASRTVAKADTLQQTMPMTDTMPMTGAMLDVTEDAPGTMPMQPATGQPGMGAMMANMAKMQGMMARMQRMMAGGMMAESMPMTGTMPMAGMMSGDMGEMMDMMAEMQEMMADMQGMMAGEMDKHMGSADMSGMGQMQGQQMGGGMMGQMPMMGTMIMIMPMPMMQGGMMQGMNMGGMMGQMPMMQGMDMGGMMGGQGGAQGGAQNTGPAAAGKPINAAAAPQTGKLGEIEIKVTPPDLTNIQGETIDFAVDLNATGADLSFDLAPLATLLIGDHKMPAEAWEVTLDHGHHVAGVLKFPAHMQGAVEGATLVLSDASGGEAFSLTWTPTE